MKAYSLDLRERVLKDCDAGLGTQAVAEKYSVSKSWIRRLKQRRREDGQIEPRPSRNKRVPKLAVHSDQIRDLISETPDLTLKELREKLGVAVALGTLWTAVARLNLTVKKKSHGRVSRTART
jgi:transposase